MSWKSSLAPWGRPRPDRLRPERRRKLRPEILRLESRWLLSGPGIMEYPASSASSQPVSAVAGSDGNLWVTEYAAKEVVAFSATGAIVKTVPVSGMPYGITAVPTARSGSPRTAPRPRSATSRRPGGSVLATV